MQLDRSIIDPSENNYLRYKETLLTQEEYSTESKDINIVVNVQKNEDKNNNDIESLTYKISPKFSVLNFKNGSVFLHATKDKHATTIIKIKDQKRHNFLFIINSPF